MDVHPTKNVSYRYWSIAISSHFNHSINGTGKIEVPMSMKLQKSIQESCLVWNHYPNFRAKLFWVFLSHMCRWSNHAICRICLILPYDHSNSTRNSILYKGYIYSILFLLMDWWPPNMSIQSSDREHANNQPPPMEISTNNHGDSCSSNHNGNMTKQKPKESTKNQDIQASWDNDAIISYSIYKSIKSLKSYKIHIYIITRGLYHPTKMAIIHFLHNSIH